MTYDIIKKITVPLLKEKIDMLTSAHATNKDTSPSFLNYTPSGPRLLWDSSMNAHTFLLHRFPTKSAFNSPLH